MKKLSLFLVLCLLAGVMFSCNNNDVTNTDKADSASDNAAVTKADIDALLAKITNYSITTDPDTGNISVSQEQSLSQEQPLFMSAEAVNALTSSNYKESYEDFEAYKIVANHLLKEYLTERLPDECIMTYNLTKPANNVIYPDKNYMILDPSAVPSGYTSDQIAEYLALGFKIAEWHSLRGGEGDVYDEELTNAINDCIKDIGVVVVFDPYYSYYYDTSTGVVEMVELFPDFKDTTMKFTSLYSSNVQQQIDAILTEDTETE